MISNAESGTNVQEIADGIYRINTPVTIVPGGFSFNQYLIVDEEPLLFHTGPRRLFPLVSQAIAAIMPVQKLRYISFSHVEADESGALNEFLAVAPNAVPLSGPIAAMVSIQDLADRPPRVIQDSEVVSLGKHAVQWFDTPHLPHAWECGFLMEKSTRTLLCGDLFTQPGLGETALTQTDILGPSEAFRHQMDYYSHTKNVQPLIQKLAATEPTTLACMHGSAWTGDGAKLLSELEGVLRG
jgi:flavorubredoxin